MAKLTYVMTRYWPYAVAGYRGGNRLVLFMPYGQALNYAKFLAGAPALPGGPLWRVEVRSTPSAVLSAGKRYGPQWSDTFRYTFDSGTVLCAWERGPAGNWGLVTPPCPPVATRRMATRAFGQEPPPPAFEATVDKVTRDGVTFQLVKPGMLTQLLASEDTHGVTPTFGKEVTIGAIKLPAAKVAWATKAATAETLEDWLGKMYREGNAVVGVEEVTLIDGKRFMGDVELVLVVTRDLELVDKLTKQSPGNAVVLFEPVDGWGWSKAMVVAGVAVAAVVVVGGAVLLARRRKGAGARAFG